MVYVAPEMEFTNLFKKETIICASLTNGAQATTQEMIVEDTEW